MKQRLLYNVLSIKFVVSIWPKAHLEDYGMGLFTQHLCIFRVINIHEIRCESEMMCLILIHIGN